MSPEEQHIVVLLLIFAPPMRPVDYSPFAAYKKELLAADDQLRKEIRRAAQTLSMDDVEAAVQDIIENATRSYRESFARYFPHAS